jgi:hypothetical protein
MCEEKFEKFEDFVFREEDGSLIGYYEEEMLIRLLKDDVLFPNGREYICPVSKKVEPETLVLFMNCNDVWAWASADAIEVAFDELPELLKYHLEDPRWGATKWACRKRNMRPQRPIRERMKQDESWDDLMESLSKNWDEKND